jgi:PAS domain S-box-containing protein
LDGIITSWNGGAERLYGYTAEEVIGKPVSVLVPPDQADELSHGFGEVGNLLCKGGTRIKLGRSDPVRAERLAPTTVHARADWALNGGRTGFVQGIDRRDVRHEQSS